ncbi:NIL domain-containing protein [Chlorogloeopsis sp. ULAP01]|uniref:NIL domain-containing protein n=1 Tax=Chlorogloeopsis sp. ULAP01 TaxID=3056483 RepID=UPI0025AB283E|nr:NIL domain-containing protein [Chlorogloeopsis sp. ULAP01]MDM9379314.1 NIL domain-containing protein [Chlorogloeopsis sp. ULAP01]
MSLVPSTSEINNKTQVRLRLYIPSIYQHQPVICQLISRYNLIVNITGAKLGKHTGGEGYFDVDIKGALSQISLALVYLESLNIIIKGKPNTDGDSWYC